MTLLECIRAKGHTVKSIAAAAGVSTRSLEQYTTGRYPLRNSRAWLIVALAKALETTPEQLLMLDDSVSSMEASP